ncbi:hypothetical protein DUZ99_07040 [Xylanibacillus composti]|uniref:DUF4064 domain-containing protein n=1 Tax=Xylanibacillus composti TaxID=1572762 RepID=A0A8J4M2I5_9BACL|nr:hypothetical protein [Xylanibacillus composti]MDT9724747.1 hypothetical protein [Xylanibacillus composti]GIQ69900.1 hypothetical protein XYCOK13_27240 [Xylanibacillus composti]
MESNEQQQQGQQPAFSEAPSASGMQAPEKHSGLGIAATVLGVLAIILAMIGFGMALSNQDILGSFDPDIADPYNLTAEEQQVVMVLGLIGLCFLGGGLLTLIGIIMGLISLFNKQRKKLFPILGTVLSAVPLVLFLFYTIIGASIA